MSDLITLPLTLFESCNSTIFSKDKKHRYVLTRVWDESKKMIAFIGLNPSTATASTDDPTIRRVKIFAHKFGYGGLYMLNLFSFITPYPEQLQRCDDPAKNDYYLIHYGDLADKIVFAWGNFETFGQDNRVIRMFPEAYCLGRNSNGSPKHPLYLKSNTDLQLFKQPKS
jgi:hypothetical protein